MRIIEYNLAADRLCIGERIKAGVFRPTAKTIPYSSIRGAINDSMGIAVDAVGVLDDIKSVDCLITGPKNRMTEIVRLPIKTMYLEGLQGRIFILHTDVIAKYFENELVLYIGGLRMKGFGRCFLSQKREYEVKETDFETGILNVRIPVTAAEVFGVTVLKEKFGYMFEAKDEETGKYILSYFEGSKVKAPKFLLERRNK